MGSNKTRVNRIARRLTARHALRADHAQQERQRVDAMSDGQLVAELARFQFVYELTQGAPDFGLCGRVDALLTAGDVASAWALLASRPRPAQFETEVIR